MGKNNKVVRIFTMEQQFPCGPKSSCCGPIGQSKEKVASLKKAIEELGLEVRIHDIKKMESIEEYPQVFKLLRSFGHMATPVITVENEVACMGQAEDNEVVSSVKSKL